MCAPVSSLLAATLAVSIAAQRPQVTRPERPEATRLDVERIAPPLHAVRADLERRNAAVTAAAPRIELEHEDGVIVFRLGDTGRPRARGAYAEALDVLDRAVELLRNPTPSMRGSVVTVSVDGKLLTVKLDRKVGLPLPGHSLAIHAGGRYKGGFVVDTVEGDFLFGRVVRAVHVLAITAGDLADSQPGRELEIIADDAGVAAAIDRAMAGLVRARAGLWKEANARVPADDEGTLPGDGRHGRLQTVKVLADAPAPPFALVLDSVDAYEAIAALAACRRRVRAAADRAAALAALDDAAKALMALQRAVTKKVGQLRRKQSAATPTAR